MVIVDFLCERAGMLTYRALAKLVRNGVMALVRAFTKQPIDRAAQPRH